MTGAVQSVALEGGPRHRPWRRSRELRASPEGTQELLPPTPVEMHKVGAGGQGVWEARAHVLMLWRLAMAPGGPHSSPGCLLLHQENTRLGRR